MTDKYRRIILFLIMIVVVVIIVDLVFNFRGIFMENYERYVKSQEHSTRFLCDLVNASQQQSHSVLELEVIY